MGRRVVAIIRREYLERVRTRAFWISTLLVPVMMTALLVVPIWLAETGGGRFDVAVLDLTGRLAPAIVTEVSEMLARESSEMLEITLTIQDPGPDPAAQREELKERVQRQEFDGVLILPASLLDDGEPEYVAPNVAAFKLLNVLESAVNDVVISARLSAAGLDPGVVGELTRRVDLKAFKLGIGGEETRDKGQVFMLSYGFVLIIFMSVIGYGAYVMRGVLEEKSSHIVEVIISTVKPFELMLGKILGIGAVGLTQMLLWALMGLALTAPGMIAGMGFEEAQLPTLPLRVMVFFVVYFVLGFLLYGTLYAGIGAAFDTEQEAQNFQAAISVFFMIPLLLMMQIFNDPDGALSIVLSQIPFFTPMLMFLRMILTQVSAVEITISLLLLVVSILALTWMVAKVYRVGILMHGARPSLKEVVRWIREA